MTFIKKLKNGAWISLAVAVIAALAYSRGDSKGYDRAIKEMAASGIQLSSTARKDQEKITHEEKNMDDAAIDRGLRDLGIMRAPNNR